MFNKKGLSLLEFLIVIAIIILLVVIVVPNLNTSRQKLALDRSATKLAQDIRWAQQMTMSSKPSEKSGCEKSYSYGVSFSQSDPDKYIVYIDCGETQGYESPGDDKLAEVELESGITFEITESKIDMLFIPPKPEIIFIPDVATVSIILKNRNDESKTIIVNKAGLVEIQ